MAIVRGNPVLQGFSGTLGGDLVFRQCGKKTVVAVKSTRRQTNSPLQQRNCNRFKEASQYARKVLNDPDKRDHYRRLARKLGKHSAYNLIIAQYMREARINLKDNTTVVRKESKRAVFSVRQGGTPVKAVTVRIVSPAGSVVSTGEARPISKHDWVYPIPTALEGNNIMHIGVHDALDRETIAAFAIR